MSSAGGCRQLIIASEAPRRGVFTRIPHTKLGGDKNMDRRRLDAESPSEEDLRRTKDGHGQCALHS